MSQYGDDCLRRIAELKADADQVREEMDAVMAVMNDEIRAAHKAGVPKKAIAAAAGISRPTLDSWLNRPTWRALCDTCGWEQRAEDYASAGDAARSHGDECAEASTCVDRLREK